MNRRNLVQGWKASDHMRRRSKTTHHPATPRPPNTRPPRHLPHHSTGGMRLLVATVARRCYGIRQGVCGMPMEQGQHSTHARSTSANHTQTGCYPLRSNCSRFHYQIAQVTRIRRDIDRYRPQLHQSVGVHPLHRRDHCGRNRPVVCQIYLCTIRITLVSHQ